MAKAAPKVEDKLPAILRMKPQKETFTARELVLDRRLNKRLGGDDLGCNPAKIAEMAEQIKDKWEIPPIHVLILTAQHEAYPAGTALVVGGFHRTRAGRAVNGETPIPAYVREGTWADAITLSYGENGRHGTPRTTAELHAVLKEVLANPEYKGLSNAHIGDICDCSHETVRKFKGEKSVPLPTVGSGTDSAGEEKPVPTVKGKDGREQRTDNHKPDKQAELNLKIRELLKEVPTIPIREIAKRCECSPTTVQAVQKELEAEQAQLDEIWDEADPEDYSEESEVEPDEIVDAVEPPEVPLDPLGQPIPANLVPFFEGTDKLRELRNKCNRLMADFNTLIAGHEEKTLSPLAAFLDVGSIRDKFKDVARAIKFGRPFCICPLCAGKGCARCKKTGFLSLLQESILPDDLRKKMPKEGDE